MENRQKHHRDVTSFSPPCSSSDPFYSPEPEQTHNLTTDTAGGRLGCDVQSTSVCWMSQCISVSDVSVDSCHDDFLLSSQRTPLQPTSHSHVPSPFRPSLQRPALQPQSAEKKRSDEEGSGSLYSVC